MDRSIGRWDMVVVVVGGRALGWGGGGRGWVGTGGGYWGWGNIPRIDRVQPLIEGRYERIIILRSQ